MRSKLHLMTLLLVLCSSAAWAASGSAVSPDPIKQLESRAADVKAGKGAEYAPEALKEAQSAITAAQAAVAGGNSKLSQQRIETANMLLTVAEAKAAERELLEKVAVQRVELKKLEAQLEKNLQGEAKP